MNPRYQGPAVFPPASEVRKRVGAHLDMLPSFEQKPTGRPIPVVQEDGHPLAELA